MLVFRRSRWLLALLFAVLVSTQSVLAGGGDREGVHDDQDEDECELLNQMKAPTIYGGSGLFNTYSTRTLDEGELSVGVFWNNFDRDPGDIDVNQVTTNFTYGLAERWEVWVNWNVWQQTTVRQPYLLSGTGYNAVQAFGRSPYVFFGPPFGGTDGGAAFFPGTGSSVGGILPSLGRFGNPIVGNITTTPNGLPIGNIGLGPAIISDRPSYYPDLPFVGQVDFFGFDNFGRPIFGPRQSGNGTGDVSFGTKLELIDPDNNWFSVAVGGTVVIPTARNRNALARGRTSGEVDYGPFVAFGQEWGDGHWRAYENIGFTFTGDPEIGDIKVLDRPNKLTWGGGLSVAPVEEIELLAELNGVHWVSGRTPNLLERDPVDLTLGARFFLYDGMLSFGGAYRHQLNALDDQILPGVNLQFIGGVPVIAATSFTFENGDHHGFVAYVGFNLLNECEDEPDNEPPSCTGVTADRSEVFQGDSVGVMANATDPDGDVLTYMWSASGGRVVGAGSNVTFDATNVAPGSYTVTAQVDDGFHHIIDCSTTIVVKERANECPTVRLSASTTTVTAGEIVTFTAMGTDPDNGPGPISYRWTTSAGSLQGSGTSVSIDTTGLDGAVTVSVAVSDGDRNCSDSESVTVNVTAEREVTPSNPTKLTNLEFPNNNARINNEHKAILDDAALRLQQDPRMMIVVDGHSERGERAGIARKRAENARDYLVNDKGIDPNRISLRSFDDKCPTADGGSNKRVELWLLPEGRTVNDIPKGCTP